MKIIEFKGRTIEDAINTGLKELGVSIDDVVEVNVLKHPGIFSKAVVQLSVEGEMPEKLDTTTAEALISRIEKRAASTAAAAPQPKQNQNNRPAMPQPKSFEKKNDAPAAQQPVQSSRPVQPEKRQERPAQPQKPVQQQKPVQAKPAEKEFSERERNMPKPTEAEMKTGCAAAEKYLSTAIKLMGIDAKLEASHKGDEVDVNIITDDMQIIGYRGETLDALEYLTLLSVGGDSRIKVNLDSGGYREKRTAALVDLAKRLADKAVKTGRKVDLEPMSSLSRKVIHSALAENDAVFTRSEGHEPNRYLVIIPKRQGSESSGPRSNNNNKRRHNNKKRPRSGENGDRQA